MGNFFFGFGVVFVDIVIVGVVIIFGVVGCIVFGGDIFLSLFIVFVKFLIIFFKILKCLFKLFMFFFWEWIWFFSFFKDLFEFKIRFLYVFVELGVMFCCKMSFFLSDLNFLLNFVDNCL